MARGKTLGELVEEVKLEAGMSGNSNIGIQFLETVKYRINEAQEYFFRDFDWSHLCGTEENGMFEVLTVAGERVYDLPTDMDPATVKAVWYKWGDAWVPLTRGIMPTDYTSQNSDDPAVMNEPALKWDFRAGETFEIFPRPATNDLPIRFQAKQKLVKLVADNDVLQLDSYIVKMRAAGYMLLRREPKEAQVKIGDAMTNYYKLRHHDTIGTKANLAGAEQDENRTPRDPSERIIAVSRG